MLYLALPNLKMGGSFHGELLVIPRGYIWYVLFLMVLQGQLNCLEYLTNQNMYICIYIKNHGESAGRRIKIGLPRLQVQLDWSRLEPRCCFFLSSQRFGGKHGKQRCQLHIQIMVISYKCYQCF